MELIMKLHCDLILASMGKMELLLLLSARENSTINLLKNWGENELLLFNRETMKKNENMQEKRI